MSMGFQTSFPGQLELSAKQQGIGSEKCFEFDSNFWSKNLKRLGWDAQTCSEFDLNLYFPILMPAYTFFARAHPSANRSTRTAFARLRVAAPSFSATPQS